MARCAPARGGFLNRSRLAAAFLFGVTSLPAQRLVTPTWLEANLGNVVVLAVATPNFTTGHIPGAQLLVFGVGLTRLQAELRSAGIEPGTEIVLYQGSSTWPIPVAQAFAVLDNFGWGKRTAILDGGFAAWKAAGGRVQHGIARRRVPAPPAADDFESTGALVDRAYITAHIGDAAMVLIDARAQEYFLGAATEDGEPAGHIPGALNLPFSALAYSDGRFRSQAEMKEALAKVGAAPGKTVVVYCHSGRKASLTYFAARLAGFDARLYPGSWRDWSTRPHV